MLLCPFGRTSQKLLRTGHYVVDYRGGRLDLLYKSGNLAAQEAAVVEDTSEEVPAAE